MRPLAITVSALALSFAALSVATGAAAQPSATASRTDADARCLLAMVALSNSDDETAQRVGQNGIVFYAGRIAAIDPTFDFNRLKTTAASMDPKAAQADLQQHCGPQLQEVMRKLETALAPPPGATPPSSAPARPPATPPKH